MVYVSHFHDNVNSTFDDRNTRKGINIAYTILGICSMAVPIYTIAVICRASHYSETTPHILMASILMVLTVLSAACASALLVSTNDDSLSGMLAQRWNPISYLAAYFLTALAYFSSALICFSFLADGNADNTAKPVLSTLCLMFLSLILVFPDRVEKTATEMGMTPTGYYYGSNRQGPGFTPAATPMGDASAHPVGQPHGAAPGTTMYYTPDVLGWFGPDLMWTVHKLFIALGSIIALIQMGTYLNKYEGSLHHLTPIAVILCMIMAGLTLLYYFVMSTVARFNPTVESVEYPRAIRLRFVCEMVFLHCLISGMVIISLAQSDTFEKLN